LNNDNLEFNEVAANTTQDPVEAADFLNAIVPNDGLETFRASILDGSRFETYGQELWVFIYPVELVEKEHADFYLEKLISDDFHPDEEEGTLYFSGLIFGSAPPLEVGKYYVEHEPYSKISTISTPLAGGILDPVTGGELTQGFDRYLPFVVTGIGVTYTLFDGPVYAVGFKRLSFLEVVKHGTIRSTIEPLEKPGGLLATEGSTGDIFPKAQPIHFNRINIADAIDLSGSFLFDPGPIGVEFEMKNLALETFLVTANFRADATLLVETKNAADNTGEPLASQQEQLFNFPLFSVVLPAGITFTPEFSMHVGAAVNAPTGLSVPIQSSMEVDITAGMKNGQPYYDTHHTATPPNISTPAIHQQLQASVEAWVAAQLLCKVSAPLDAIGGGPTLGTRVGGEFTFAPLADPWWTLEGQLEFLGGVELELAGLVTVLDEEKVIGDPVELFTFEADGPLFPPLSLRSINLPDNPGIRPVGGNETRWARALQTTSATSPGTTDHFIHLLTYSDDLIAGSGTDISRYGPDGELKWTLAAGPNTRRSVPNPDGGFTVLGDHFDKNLARFDGDGNRLWSVTHRPASGGLALNDLVVREVGGEPEYFAVGWGGTTLNDNKPAILKFDGDGNLLWSKAYLPDPAGGEIATTVIQRGLVTSDGNLVLIGITTADVASGQTGSNTVNVSNNGFVMKVDGDTGAVLWTTLLAIAPTPHLNSLAEGPDGSLYIGGSIVPSALQPVPSLLVAKLAANGGLVDSVLIGSIFSDSAQPTGYTSSPVPHTGANVFDRIHAMLWADGALWIGGNIGSPGGSTVTDGQSAFTARLTPDLGVTRFAIHAGASSDFIGALAHGGDGLLACGWTKSFLPWPAGAASENDSTPVARLIMKLPWEGLLRFHDLSNGNQPAADDPAPTRGSHYVYPRIIAASDTTLFSARFPSSGELPDTLVPASDLPMIVSDFALIDGFFPPNAPAKITPLAHHQIEFVPEEIVEDFASYTNYHQIDADEDSDNDGLDLATEFYHGTDPLAADSVNLELTTHPLTGETTLSFPRSPLASAEGWAAPILKSPNLKNWGIVPAINLDAIPNGPDGDLLYLTPFILPGEPRQFYRLAPALAP
jgi:outer membrane protein assembly factor BamB